MQKRVSVKDIAQELNISLSTVHKALTGKPGVGDKKRKEVLETAQRMGYEVNSVAQVLSRKSIKLGILMPSQWQEYFADMKKGIENEIQNLAKYKVSAFFFDYATDSANLAIDWIKENEIDALIYCPSFYSLQENLLEELDNIKLPVFMAGDSFENIGHILCVITDASLSGRIAADFLRCVKGKTLKAAVFTGSLKVKSHKEKITSFSERIENLGGEISFVCETEDDPNKTYEYTKMVCEAGVNAIYVTTATSAPVCRYIDEHNLCDTITLISTDVFDELKYYMKKNVVKATIFQNQDEVGKKVVREAYEYLVRKNSYGNDHIETECVIRIRPSIFLLADIE